MKFTGDAEFSHSCPPTIHLRARLKPMPERAKVKASTNLPEPLDPELVGYFRCTPQGEPHKSKPMSSVSIPTLRPVRRWTIASLPSRRVLWVGIALVAIIGLALRSVSLGGSRAANLVGQAVWQPVDRSDLQVVVLERGSLESQSSIELICEVEDVRKDNINGTTILWMIPNGASVKKGDLIVELDSNPMQEALDEQVLYTENALAEKIQAEANLKNQLTMNATAEAEAQLLIKLAELELEMYTDSENGTHKLQVDANKRRIDDVNNEILAAQATMELRREEQRGIQSLFKLGYANRNEVRRIELTYLQAEQQFAAKLNQLQTELSTLKKSQVYDQRKELLALEGKLATAKRGLEQVLRNNEARLAQTQALMRAKDESYKKEEERLARYKMQLEKCKIYAPQKWIGRLSE